MTNPLLGDWSTPFDLPPYADISDADFEEAFAVLIDEARAEIAAIADGTVVGSAIVNKIAEGQSVEDIAAYVKTLADGAHRA